MTRLRLLLALAAAFAAPLAGCDAVLSPLEDDGPRTEVGLSAVERMPGTWRYRAGAFGTSDAVDLDIDADLTATRWQHYAGAGCREADIYRVRYEPLTDSTVAETTLQPNGQATPGETLGVRVSATQLRFLYPYRNADGTSGTYPDDLRQSPAPLDAVRTCAFQLAGVYTATLADGAAFPRTYTATDSTGTVRTYRLSAATLYIGTGYAGIELRQALVTGTTAGPAQPATAFGRNVVASAGAWSADLSETRAMPGLRLAGTPSAGRQTVRLQRAGMAQPLVLTFGRTASRTASRAAPGDVRRPSAPPEL